MSRKSWAIQPKDFTNRPLLKFSCEITEVLDDGTINCTSNKLAYRIDVENGINNVKSMNLSGNVEMLGIAWSSNLIFNNEGTVDVENACFYSDPKCREKEKLFKRILSKGNIEAKNLEHVDSSEVSIFFPEQDNFKYPKKIKGFGLGHNSRPPCIPEKNGDERSKIKHLYTCRVSGMTFIFSHDGSIVRIKSDYADRGETPSVDSAYQAALNFYGRPDRSVTDPTTSESNTSNIYGNAHPDGYFNGYKYDLGNGFLNDAAFNELNFLNPNGIGLLVLRARCYSPYGKVDLCDDLGPIPPPGSNRKEVLYFDLVDVPGLQAAINENTRLIRLDATNSAAKDKKDADALTF